MLLHTFVRFEPIPGKEQQLREELKSLLEPTRAEPGCIRIHLYETLRDPFLGLVGELVTHHVKGIRPKQIA